MGRSGGVWQVGDLVCTKVNVVQGERRNRTKGPRQSICGCVHLTRIRPDNVPIGGRLKCAASDPYLRLPVDTWVHDKPSVDTTTHPLDPVATNRPLAHVIPRRFMPGAVYASVHADRGGPYIGLGYASSRVSPIWKNN